MDVSTEHQTPDQVLAAHFMITDYSMPGENGASLIMHTRQQHPSIPVILTTGLGQIEETELETTEGILMLNKPFKKADLLQAINQLLTLSRPSS